MSWSKRPRTWLRGWNGSYFPAGWVVKRDELAKDIMTWVTLLVIDLGGRLAVCHLRDVSFPMALFNERGYLLVVVEDVARFSCIADSDGTKAEESGQMHVVVKLEMSDLSWMFCVTGKECGEGWWMVIKRQETGLLINDLVGLHRPADAAHPEFL